MYIYKITIEVNNKEKFYIGKCSTGDVNYCGSGKILKRYYNKYGKDIIKNKQILYETNDIFELNEAEKFFIQIFNAATNKNYLNIAIGGEGGNTFAGLTSQQIDTAMQKRELFYKNNPHILEQRVEKFKKTFNTPEVRLRWKQNLMNSQPKKIEAYKKTYQDKTIEQKNIISKNISDAVKKYHLNVSEHIKQERKEKEMKTKSLRTSEQKSHESRLKSEASKKAAIIRSSDSEKKAEYSTKVSNGVKQWRSSQTVEEREKAALKYKLTCYTKNGMLQHELQVRDMLLNNKSSLEIFHFLQNAGVNTHHICVKGFIDFLKTEANL